MIRLVAFDWNGTLFADTFAVYESNNGVFKLFNKKPVSFRAFQKYFDVPVKKYYSAVGISEHDLNSRSTQIAETFHTYYEARAAKIRTRAGAKALLQFLAKEEIDCVIFSNHIVEPIKKQLLRLKLEKYFPQVLANLSLEDSLNGRSKKDRLQKYAKSKQISSDQILIVGDTIEEIEIGKELGSISVAITHGNCSVTRLKAEKPDYLINNLKEIIKIVKTYIK